MHTLERWKTQEEMENVVKPWLRATIKRLQEERDQQPAVANSAWRCSLQESGRQLLW